MKARDALDVGSSAATVVTFVVGVAVLAWSAVNDKLVLGLGFALVASVLLNVFLLASRRPRPVTIDPALLMLKAMATPPGPTYRLTGMERHTVSAVLDLMSEAMDRFEYDNAHGSSDAGDDARSAARSAKTKAEAIPDTTAREAVGLFEQAVVHSPRGWKEQGGANLEQMNRVRDAHTAAVRLVGTLLRPVEPGVGAPTQGADGSGSA